MEVLLEEAKKRYGGKGSIIKIRGESRNIINNPIGNMIDVFIIVNNKVYTFLDVNSENDSYELIRLYDGEKWIDKN